MKLSKLDHLEIPKDKARFIIYVLVLLQNKENTSST